MESNDLCYLSAVRQRCLIDSREISVLELIDAHIERIETHNPSLNAFVTLRLDAAREDAKSADGEIAKGLATGVLHGLPIGVKDCFQTKGLRTTMGCLALSDYVPDFDHSVVAREKAAGAIVLGKLNTPEFTMASNLCTNPIFGPTRNPWNLSLCPGVSSGGSGAALAAGLCSLADGSDIGGSVRNPAAWCNIVGHRPSAFMVPDVPNSMPWHNMNTPGPMARSVEDAALFLSVMAGPHPHAPVVVQVPFPPGLPDLKRDLQGLRIGWSRDHGSLSIDEELGRNFDALAAVFETFGCEVSQRDISMDEVDWMYQILCYERVAADTKPIYDTHREGLDDRLVSHYERFRNLTGEDFLSAHRARQDLWQDVADAFDHFDILIWPNEAFDAYDFDDEQRAESHDWRLLYVAPLLGLPAITVPAGFSLSGAPRGLQVLGAPGADLLVAQVAYAFEQATGFGTRRPEL